MTVEAGCILQTLQETALAHDRLFPLSLAAEGSCEIGEGTHTVIMEKNRMSLFREVQLFLDESHVAAK